MVWLSSMSQRMIRLTGSNHRVRQQKGRDSNAVSPGGVGKPVSASFNGDPLAAGFGGFGKDNVQDPVLKRGVNLIRIDLNR